MSLTGRERGHLFILVSIVCLSLGVFLGTVVYAIRDEMKIKPAVVSPWYEMIACARFGRTLVEVVGVSADAYLVARVPVNPNKRVDFGYVVDHKTFEDFAQPTRCPERKLPAWARKRAR